MASPKPLQTSAEPAYPAHRPAPPPAKPKHAPSCYPSYSATGKVVRAHGVPRLYSDPWGSVWIDRARYFSSTGAKPAQKGYLRRPQKPTPPASLLWRLRARTLSSVFCSILTEEGFAMAAPLLVF